MLTNRRRYVTEQKKLNADLIEKHGKIPENYLKATELRLNFFRKYILNAVSIIINSINRKDMKHLRKKIGHM